MDNLDIDELEIDLYLSNPHFLPDHAYNTFLNLVDLIRKKDEIISNKDIELKANKDIILKQIDEIMTIHKLIDSFQFYPKHKKDHYSIDFGMPSRKIWSYRYCLSSREGKKICDWVVSKKTRNSKAIQEFKEYLIELGYC